MAPNEFLDIQLGNVLTWLLMIAATCKGVKTLESAIDKKIESLHEGLMLREERRIDDGERTPLWRIVDKVTRRIFGDGG